ncbi:MAG: EamA family transporter [Agromyces sp.]
MIAVIFALASSLAFGISDFYGGLATRKIGAVATTLASYTTGSLIIALGLLLIPGEWSVSAVLFGALAGVSIALGFLAFYASIARGPIAILAPLIAVLYATVPVAWAIARGEQLPVIGWVGVAVGVLAVLALSIPPKGGAESDEERREDERAGRRTGPTPIAVVLGILASLGLGGATIALDYVPEQSGVTSALIESVVAVLVAAIAWAFTRRPRIGRPEARALGTAAWSGLLLGAGNAVFVLALQAGSLALVSVLVGLYPLSTILLARFVLKEHLSRVQWSGVVLALAAAVLLGLG